jgi:hypothetical protein
MGWSCLADMRRFDCAGFEFMRRLTHKLSRDPDQLNTKLDGSNSTQQIGNTVQFQELVSRLDLSLLSDFPDPPEHKNVRHHDIKLASIGSKILRPPGPFISDSFANNKTLAARISMPAPKQPLFDGFVDSKFRLKLDGVWMDGVFHVRDYFDFKFRELTTERDNDLSAWGNQVISFMGTLRFLLLLSSTWFLVLNLLSVLPSVCLPLNFFEFQLESRIVVRSPCIGFTT